MERMMPLEKNHKPHIVVFPFPGQGHMNPLMELAKRLLSKNLRVTFIITDTTRKRMFESQGAAFAPILPDFRFETISDGIPSDIDVVKNIDMLFDQIRIVGGQSFERFIESLNSRGDTVHCIVFDSLGLQWVPEVAKKFNIPSAVFWSQSCAVCSIYYHYTRGIIKVEAETEEVHIRGLPQMRLGELPSLLHPSNPYGAVMRHMLDQFNPISEATWILANSFYQLEAREINSLDSILPIKAMGPLVPLGFLAGNNGDVVPHLWKAATNCVEWLSTKGDSTVVYVSFGSVAVISKEQTEEIAMGLRESGHPFLWVIRPTHHKEENNSAENLPEGFVEETAERGLVVPWSPQMEVLSHPSLGVFMTHCGWNSITESLTCGVPILAVPQWGDQTTNSKYVEEEWKTGIRLNKREDGLIGREEVEKSIRTVMESEVGVQLRENALRWKTLAKEAMMKGGSSDKNIEDFIEEVIARTPSMSSNSP